MNVRELRTLAAVSRLAEAGESVRTDAAAIRRVVDDARAWVALQSLTVGRKAIPAPEMLDELRVLREELKEVEGCPPGMQELLDRILRILGHPKAAEDFAEGFGKALATKGRSLLVKEQARALITRHTDAAERREQRPQIDRPRAGPEELAEARVSRAFRKQLEELVPRKPMKSSFREAVEEIARKGRRRLR